MVGRTLSQQKYWLKVAQKDHYHAVWNYISSFPPWVSIIRRTENFTDH